MFLRKLLPYTSAAVVIAFLYAGWTIYSRRSENQRLVEEAVAKKRAFDQKTLDMIGSDLKITQFYAAPAAIHQGEQTLVCYGVANAKSVRIEPALESITPTLSRCLQAKPGKSTEYTLTAEDGAGHNVTQTILVKVQ